MLKKKQAELDSTTSNHTVRSNSANHQAIEGIEWGEEATGLTEFLAPEQEEDYIVKIGPPVQYPEDTDKPKWKTHLATDLTTGKQFKLPTHKDLWNKLGSVVEGSIYKLTYTGTKRCKNGNDMHVWTVVPAK